jgi:(2Fe-2S) ferredoxin
MSAEASRAANALSLDSTQRHIFLCVKSSEQACCARELALKSWEHLKVRLKQLGLSEQGGVQRTKADCLRICVDGPIAVIYPEGIWYRNCTPENLDRIITQHLLGGKTVEELRFAGPTSPSSLSS